MGRAFATAGLALLAGCRAAAPPPPEVRLHATVGDLAVRAVASGAERRGLARVAVVSGGPGAADVGWFSDPTEALEAAGALVAGAAPAQPDVDPRWKDPAGRFAAVCARARLLVAAPRAPLPFAPASLRDLADPRLAGRVALAPPGAGAGPAGFAALSLAYGEASLERFLRLLAANRPRLAASDEEVPRLVAAGGAAVGLTGSEPAAAAAASAAALDVVYPDQGGGGAVALPTALALLRGGAASEAARRLLAWMAGPDAEALIVARAPGMLPLRRDVPVPVGVRPAGSLRTLPVDWDRLVEEKRRLAPRLRRWPEP